ncbi:carbohydrate-binding module family 14 protein [Streptomyces sp. NBC_01433]|uniref:carbohydrate-binding module family 14 protein n=1 Tax=Streptomyces sp. NBC_01433 TaxID=2903864 RepID=UPI00224EA873|nr:carbohydrate-binding module family 14 protein [Streptomyces sp. NBC_01433]MCX4674148.1 carbohydrate-binding module family 14 protein [Streptomyces sp. NBC_01433]
MAASAALAVGVLCLPAYAASAQTPAAPSADLYDGSSCGDHLHGDLFADPDDPGRFYHCSWGVAYQKDCPSTLHFNPDLMVCDWPENAGNPAAGKD